MLKPQSLRTDDCAEKVIKFYADRLKNDNHGSFYLKDIDGNIVDYNYNIYFVNQYEQPGRIDYCEFVFDIPQEKIGSYTLYGNFVTSGMITEGNWRVTFPLEQAK